MKSLLHEERALNLSLVHAGLPPQWDMPTARSCAREVEQALKQAGALDSSIARQLQEAQQLLRDALTSTASPGCAMSRPMAGWRCA